MKRVLMGLVCLVGLVCVQTANAADCARVKTWGAETLTYTDLNAEFDRLISCVNTIDSDKLQTLTATVDVDIAANTPGLTIDKTGTGAGDLLSLTNGGTGNSISTDSANFTVNKSGVVSAKSLSAPCVYFDGGYACNCKISYADSTLTISGAAAALSATNKCVIGMNNASAAPAAFEIVADVTTTFGAASDTDGNAFGITITADWGSAMPMYLHYCDGSGADYFAFSRNPARIETGNAAGDMCQEGDEDCDAQGDMFIMSSGLTLADEVDRPCLTIGSLQATFSTTDDKWAVGTIVAGRDGFGLFQRGVEFTMPVGQMGAAAGKHIPDNSGTAPLFDTEIATYYITKSGLVTFGFRGFGAGDPGGIGNNSTSVAAPYKNAESFDSECSMNIKYDSGAGLTYRQDAAAQLGTTSSGVRLFLAESYVQHAFLSAADVYVAFSIIYQAF